MFRTLLPPILLMGLLATPLIAQDSGRADRRIEKLEREMRAVQRQVFPGGAGAGAAPTILQPEIAPQTPTGAPGSPAEAPVAALTGRIAALEAQLATQTGQNEEAQNQLRQLEQRVTQLSEELARRPAPTPTPEPGTVAPPTLSEDDEEAAPAADDERAAQVAAVERPDTGDAIEDGYTYGFRLWQARLYPEAAAALKTVADANPRHRRYSWAQNLLGRAYLDDGKPALAAVAFYDNYQANRQGERAADSLYYLGVALTQQNKRTDACRVFGEFREVYGATARPELQTQVAEARTRARCRA